MQKQKIPCKFTLDLEKNMVEVFNFNYSTNYSKCMAINFYLQKQKLVLSACTLMTFPKKAFSGKSLLLLGGIFISFLSFGQVNVGNYVFADVNSNGLQDDGAANGINNVTVQLWSAGPDGTINGGDDIFISSEVTANDVSGDPGYFNFTAVSDGNYYLKFPLQVKNFFLTRQSAGDKNLDSDVNRFSGESILFTISGLDKTDLDAGYSTSFPVCPSVCEKQFISQHIVSKPEVIFDIENDTFRLPKFDASLGELLKTEIEGKADIRMVYQFENRGSTPRSIFLAYFDTTTTTGPGLGSGLRFTAQDTVVNTTLPPTDGVNFSGPDFISDSLFIGSFAKDTSLTNPVDLAGFTGNDSLTYLFNAKSSTISTSSGTLYRLILTYAKVEVTVRYTYCRKVCGSIGNFVWNDLNKDGIQDPREPGIANVTVTLFDSNGNIAGVTQTDAFGFYTFNNVLPGDYSVSFSLPADYTFTSALAGGNTNTDSDPDPFTGRTAVFTLLDQENKTDIDAGMYFQEKNTASLGNRVWFDRDDNGIQDAGEVGVANVTVTLYDGTGTVPAGTAITNTDGEYYFRNLAPGTYRVGITQPQGYTLAQYNQGGDDASDSDINPATGLTDLITLASGQMDYTWDAGIILSSANTASVGDFVWNDLNKNGIQEEGEPGVPGITVTLFDTTNTVVATTITDAFGKYIFNNVAIDISPVFYRSNYYIVFTIPSNYSTTIQNTGDDNTDSDINPSGTTAKFILNPGDDIVNIDAGIYRNDLVNATASIGDFVWLDENKNGIQDADEKGVAGITVTLLDNLGNIVAFTVTDANGAYIFTDLPAGDYRVVFSNLPFGTEFTPPGQGTTLTDSDPNPLTGATGLISLADGEANTSVDAGIISGVSDNGNASLGDYVWYDLNFNGSQDPNEPGVQGVTVTLTNIASTLTLVTKTDGEGRYLFNGLNPDQYILTFSGIPAGYNVTTLNADSNDEKDSDADPLTLQTVTITLGDGQNDLSWDMGIFNPVPSSSIGDFVWLDVNQNGIQEPGENGVPGVTVTLYDALNNPVAVALTNDAGYYIFTDVPPGDYIIVFSNLPAGFNFSPSNNPAATEATDSDADPVTGQTLVFTLPAATFLQNVDAGVFNTRATIGDFVWEDVNNNGIQDTGEKGVSGITVYLLSAAGDTLASAVTNGEGLYLFPNISPDQYQLAFGDIPANTLFTIQDATGNAPDDTDSDTDPANGTIPVFSVSAGEYNLTYDAGLYGAPRASLNGIVWYDNGDGIRQDNELPVSGVTVTLFDVNTGNPVSVTVTGSDGYYFFENILPGTYEVVFSVFPEGLGLTITDANGNANDDRDSDATAVSPPGTFPLIATGGTVTVNAGDNIAGPDAGILPSAGLQGKAWTDNNRDGIRQINDLGISRVKVKLSTSDAPNTVIRSTVTGEEGFYQFLNLTPGVSYIVKFDSVPSRSWTEQFVGSDSTIDSDVYNWVTAPDSNERGKTPVLSPLRVGELRPNIDAGYLRPGEGLPVVLTTFDGILIGSDVLLNWKTVTEVNSSHFVIQRSLDGFANKSEGEDIGVVEAKGNSNETENYKFKDNNVTALNVNTIWYRLKMIDIDGTFEYSKEIVEVRMDEGIQDIYMSQYPNPATNQISIDYQLFEAKYGELSIVNALGQVVYQSNLSADDNIQLLSIDVKDWARGAYMIRIATENSVLTRRLLLE